MLLIALGRHRTQDTRAGLGDQSVCAAARFSHVADVGGSADVSSTAELG
jgi:hypothetical protein